MHPGVGGGGRGSWRQTQWIWPLPTTGPVVLVCEWPAMNLQLTRSKVDAPTIFDAVARAQVVSSMIIFPSHPQQTAGPARSPSSGDQARATQSRLRFPWRESR
jgi:hypothetical protein